MQRHHLAAALLSLSLFACAGGAVRANGSNDQEDVGKCDVVRPILELERAGVDEAESRLVVVYLRPEGASYAERFFAADPGCDIPGYLLQQDGGEETFALFLTPQGSGYAYELVQGGVGALPVPEAEGMPTSKVVPRDSGGWFVFN